MSEPAPEVAPWVAPYLPDFRELLRQLERVPGFIFQPVVLPSPDLARALADWLAAEGVAVRVFDMRHERWEELAARLLAVTFEPAEERRAVVVITPIELDRDAVRDGFLTLNSVRDTLARTLQCPLLWCGGVDLLRTTANLATDLWSIAGTVYRIPIRARSDVPGHLGLPNMWWTGASRYNIDDIAARFTSARERDDARAMAREGLDLAEAQLARGERVNAAETLVAIESAVLCEDSVLAARWRALRDAVRAASIPSPDAVAALQAEIAAARARGALHVEGALHIELARLLHTSGRDAEAFASLLAARALFFRVGDESATAWVESLLAVSYPGLLSGELTASIREHAELLTQYGSASVRRDGWSILAALARHEQRWTEADEAAAAMLCDLPPESPARMRALGIRSDVAISRGDWDAAVAHQSELIDFALAHQAPAVAIEALQGRALAHGALGHLREACRDLATARALARQIGDYPNEVARTVDLSMAARRLGAAQVHAALTARAFQALVLLGGTLVPEYVDGLRALGDQELADILAGLTDEPETRVRAADHLTALADAREQALRARGVDLSDPDTWPIDATLMGTEPSP